MSLLAALGLRPDGDPDAMRAYAARLRAAAGEIQSACEGAAAGVDRATFVGPAGDRTRTRASRARGRGREAATQLRDLADEITRRAGDVERRQHAWDGLRDRLERELREVTGR